VLTSNAYVELSSRYDYLITVLFVNKEGALKKIDTLKISEDGKRAYRQTVESPAPNMGQPINERGLFTATSCMLVKSRDHPDKFWLAIYEEQTWSRYAKIAAAAAGVVLGTTPDHRRRAHVLLGLSAMLYLTAFLLEAIPSVYLYKYAMDIAACLGLAGSALLGVLLTDAADKNARDMAVISVIMLDKIIAVAELM
jgi:hypothetical protein